MGVKVSNSSLSLSKIDQLTSRTTIAVPFLVIDAAALVHRGGVIFVTVAWHGKASPQQAGEAAIALTGRHIVQ